MNEISATSLQPERTCAYRVLRYTPNLVRDEWVNIGVLVYDPRSGERRLRVIEEQQEYARVRRLHPEADEPLLRALRDDLESRFDAARATNGHGANGGGTNGAALEELLRKWDDTLSNALQLAPQKGVISDDLDAELDRLYTDHVAPPRVPSRVDAPGTRAQMRSYCAQVIRQARLWDLLDFHANVRASDFTFPGDPMRIDFTYRYNGTRGFIQMLSVSRSPADCKGIAHTFGDITAKSSFKTQLTAVTDLDVAIPNDRNRFVSRTLRDAGIEPVPLDHFAVWVGKLKPMIQ